MGCRGSISLSCRLEVLPGDDIGRRFANAKEYGFDAVSLPGRYLADYLDQLRERLPDLALPVAYISLGFRGSLVSPAPNSRAQCKESLLELFDLCAILGARGVNMPPVLLQDNPEHYRSEDFEEPGQAVRIQDDLLVEQLPLLADEATKRNAVLLLEPVNRYESEYMNTVTHAARVYERLAHPNLGVTADFFHMQLEELSTAASLEEAGHCVKHVHVAENTRVEPGPGSLDFAPGFAALKGLGYSQIIEVECRSLSGPPEEVLPRSARYLRELWENA
jgi:sugar phosphate isomerase/epimerase